MPRNFRRRFGGRRSRSAVTQSTTVLKRKSKCRGCGQTLNVGDTVTRLRLKKSIAIVGCVTCGRRLVKLKNYHPRCCPTDINKAMGYDPTAHVHGVPPPVAASVPPPPKPKTPQDLQLEAIAALEAALMPKARALGVGPAHTKLHGLDQHPPKYVDGCKACAIEKAFKTFQGVKARVLRPGTPAEGEMATPIALKRIIDLAFA